MKMNLVKGHNTPNLNADPIFFLDTDLVVELKSLYPMKQLHDESTFQLMLTVFVIFILKTKLRGTSKWHNDYIAELPCSQ